METRIEITGLDALLDMPETLGPGFVANLVGGGLGAAANVVRNAARKQNFVFKDDTGRLRKSIRARRTPAYYGGRRFKRGKATVFAGGEGARQAYLVEEGHGPPVTSPPYPYLMRAVLNTQSLQAQKFSDNVSRRFPVLVRRFMRRGTARGTVFGRTLARRARSR